MLLTTIRKESRSRNSHFTPVEGSVAASYFDGEPTPITEAQARVIEGDVLRAIDVGDAEESAFTAFLDGIQRAEVKLYYGAVPIVYAYGAAVIRERHDHQMRTLRTDGADFLTEREALFYPSEHVPATEMHVLASESELVDTTPEGSKPLPLFPPLLHSQAAHHVNGWREGLERVLASRWCGSAAGRLLIDGSLTISPEVAACPNAIGIIKSHRTRFFDGDDARVLLTLQCGQRTSVFEPGTRRVTPVRSWYLRLRSADNRDVFWGLVRIEMSVSHAPEQADRISRWLLAETMPLSLPDGRWDRLLYPIHDCEAFLRARAPRL